MRNLGVALLEACYLTRNFPVALREEPAVPAVRREIVLPVPRERAWELLTDEAELSEWLADEVELEPEPGGPVRARWWERDEERDGVVEDVEPGEWLRFRWRDGAQDASRVEWRLEDAVGGTRVVVTERRVAAAAFAWGPRLDALAQASALCLA
jgi:uncharacterized protein YndB with AHSA1/START domain